MAYNRINSIARGVGIASLALTLSACGGPVEREWKPDSGLSDAMRMQYPWRVLMCEDLRQVLQKTAFSPEERQSYVEQCENECKPPGVEASRRFCTDIYCCFQAGYPDICGEFNDSWQSKEFPYSIYLECMKRFDVKPY